MTVNNSQSKASQSEGGKTHTKTLTMSHTFQCTGSELYAALTEIDVNIFWYDIYFVYYLCGFTLLI